jgi:glycosyltransferase involved in cell wall biosynthesis
MLLKILQRLDRRKFAPMVVSLLDEGTVGKRIEALGVHVVCLRMDRWYRILAAPFLLARLIRCHRFLVIQGWMYHGNLLAWVGRWLAGSKAPLSFGIRQSFYGLARERFNTRWIMRANSWLSGRMQGCLFNSRFSLKTHRDFGFWGHNMQVIPNGFDLDAYIPLPGRREVLRTGLGLGQVPVVGMVARFHPVKGHRNFLQAAVMVRQSLPQVKFLLVGTGVTEDNKQLAAWVEELGLKNAVLLMGERSDIADLNNVFDIACLASWAEAFPNVVGEAMACGIPCVSTDVGDCADIVGDTGRVVPAGDPASMAAAILELLNFDPQARQDLGRAARRRVAERFDMRGIVHQYEHYFHSLLDCSDGGLD